MPKKANNSDLDEVGEFKVYEASQVAPLVNDFGRQDLNELRDKINEVIAHL